MLKKLLLMTALAVLWAPPLWAENNNVTGVEASHPRLPPTASTAPTDGAAHRTEGHDKSRMAASAESAAASALAASGGGAGGQTLANSAVGSLAGPAAMTVPGAVTAAPAVPAPAFGAGSIWLDPALWLLLAAVLLALGLYYWWKSQWEEEYETEDAAENPDGLAWGGLAREPAVDIDRAFIFDPGPVTAPLGGLSLARPLSPFALVFPQTGREISLPNGAMSIGSARDNHIVLEETEVAPNQAEIYVTNGECDIMVMDAGGRIRLNGRPLTALRTLLKPGDELVIGRTRAFLKRDGVTVNRDKYREYQRQTAKN